MTKIYLNVYIDKYYDFITGSFLIPQYVLRMFANPRRH